MPEDDKDLSILGSEGATLDDLGDEPRFLDPGRDEDAGTDLMQDILGTGKRAKRQGKEPSPAYAAVRSLVAPLDASVLCAFEAWLEARRSPPGRPQVYPDWFAADGSLKVAKEQLLGYWIAAVVIDHLRLDEQRPPEDRQYDWEALHLRAISPLLAQELRVREQEATLRARRQYARFLEEIQAGRMTLDEALAALQVPPDVP